MLLSRSLNRIFTAELIPFVLLSNTRIHPLRVTTLDSLLTNETLRHKIVATWSVLVRSVTDLNVRRKGKIGRC